MKSTEVNEVNEQAEREFLSTPSGTLEGTVEVLRSEYRYTDKSDEELAALAARLTEEKASDLAYGVRRMEYETRYRERIAKDYWRTRIYEPLRPAEARDDAAQRLAAVLVQQTPDAPAAAIATRAYDIACALRDEAARRDAK